MFNELLQKHYRDSIGLFEEIEDMNYILPFSTFCSHSVLDLVRDNSCVANDGNNSLKFIEFVSNISKKRTEEIKDKYILSLVIDLYLEQYRDSYLCFSKEELISDNIKNFVSSKEGCNNFLSNKQTWNQVCIFETLSFVFTKNQSDTTERYEILKDFSEFREICFDIEKYRNTIKNLRQDKTTTFEEGRWIDILSALNYKFKFINGTSECNLTKALEIISKLCQQWTTLSDACMLYVRDIDHISAIYTIMNCKTLAFYKALRQKLNDALKAGVITKMEDVRFTHSINEKINDELNPRDPIKPIKRSVKPIDVFVKEWWKQREYFEWKHFLQQKAVENFGKVSLSELSDTEKEKGYLISIRETNLAIRRVFKQLILELIVKARKIEDGKYNNESINIINNAATAEEAINTILDITLSFSNEILDVSFQQLIGIEEKWQNRQLSLVERGAARKGFDKIVNSIRTKAMEGAKHAFREKTNDIARTPTITTFEELQRLFNCSTNSSFFADQLCRYIRRNPTYFIFANHAQISRRSLLYVEESSAFWYTTHTYSYDFTAFKQRCLAPLKKVLENSREASIYEAFKEHEYKEFFNSEKILGSIDEVKTMRAACILVCIEMSNLPTREEINVMLDDIGFMPLDSKSNFDKSVMSLLIQIQDKKTRERLQNNLIVEFPAENVNNCLKSTLEIIHPLMAISEETLNV